MTSAYSKSCGYKKFSVHTNTKKYRFQIVPLWKAFSKSSVFVDLFYAHTSVDGRRIRNNKVAFSNLPGIVWTGPKTFYGNPLDVSNIHDIVMNDEIKLTYLLFSVYLSVMLVWGPFRAILSDLSSVRFPQ